MNFRDKYFVYKVLIWGKNGIRSFFFLFLGKVRGRLVFLVYLLGFFIEYLRMFIN